MIRRKTVPRSKRRARVNRKRLRKNPRQTR
jgi:hypothetical protein